MFETGSTKSDINEVVLEQDPSNEEVGKLNENIVGVVDMLLLEKRGEILELLSQMEPSEQLKYLHSLLGFDFTKLPGAVPTTIKSSREIIDLLYEGESINERELFYFAKQIHKKTGATFTQEIIADRMSITPGYLSTFLNNKKEMSTKRRKELVNILCELLSALSESIGGKEILRIKFEEFRLSFE